MEVIKGGGGETESNVIPLHDGLPVDPEKLAFVIQLALNTGNASAASRALGWKPERGRKILARHPELRNISQVALGMGQRETIRHWRDMHRAALQTFHDLNLNAEDERVRLAAAEKIIERCEGKPAAGGLPPEAPEEEITDNLTMRFAAAKHFTEGVTLADGILYAEKHPEEVQAWAVRHGIIQAA